MGNCQKCTNISQEEYEKTAPLLKGNFQIAPSSHNLTPGNAIQMQDSQTFEIAEDTHQTLSRQNSTTNPEDKQPIKIPGYFYPGRLLQNQIHFLFGEGVKVYRTSCGHQFSEIVVRQYVRQQLISGHTEILCPKKVGENDEECGSVWKLPELQKLGGFSKNEILFISKYLDLNASKNMKISSENIQKGAYRRNLSKQNIRLSEGQRFSVPVEVKYSKKPLEIDIRQSTEKQLLKKITIQIKLINKQVKYLQIARNSTIQQTKQQIFNHLDNLYKPEQTILKHNDKILSDVSKLSYLTTSQTTQIRLTQKKAELHQIAQLRKNKDKEDEITNQKGVAYLSCCLNHPYSISAMRSLIKTSLQQNQSVIKCQQLSNGTKCDKQISRREWITIGRCTTKETNHILTKLSENWIRKNKKRCPFGNHDVINYGLETRRVRCIVCKSPDFCFDCLQQWRNKGKICMSQICIYKRKAVTNAPLLRRFIMRRKDTGADIVVMAPICRACPNCGAVIQSTTGCKHVPCSCRSFEETFCYVCLSVKSGKGWQCGKWNEYCGYLAPNQVFP